MAAYLLQAAIFALGGGGHRPQGGARTLPPSTRPTQVIAAGFCAKFGGLPRSPRPPYPRPLGACKYTPPLKYVARWATAGAPPKPLPPHLPPLGRAEARPPISTLFR